MGFGIAAIADPGRLLTAPPAATATKRREKPRRPADMVLWNARIYTAGDGHSPASVVAIRGGKIEYVGEGENRSWQELVGPNTNVVDVQGRTIIPGFVDSHTHPGLVALSSWHISLPRTNDLNTILNFVRQYAADHPLSDVPFVYGEYYPSDMDWGPNGPTGAAIDAAVSDRPVLLQDFSDHASTVNSKMLELLGVDEDTPMQIDPNDPGPQFVRGANGVSPTGLVREHAWTYFADTMYDAIGWRPPEDVTPALLEPFTSFLSANGIVALLDAATSRSALSSAAALDAQGKLNLYYHGAKVFSSLANLDASIAEIRAWQEEFGGAHVKVAAMKLFLDGTNEAGTGAVLDPLIKEGGDHGLLRMSEADLTAAMQTLDAEDIDLHVHVVGDRGFRVALNAVERAKENRGEAWRIQVTLSHDELIDPSDMPRVAELGVLLNWTPHWSGGYFGVAAADHLGWERFNRMYQFNPVITSGGTVTYGSDVVTQYEANRADPFFGMQVARSRIDPQYPMQSGPGTVEGTQIRKPLSARLSLADLLQGYTRNGAIQLRLEVQMGSIEVGKVANLSVLDADLFDVPDDKIQDVEPDAVLFEGRLIHGALT
jgi:predicted amidohydrolase YtcJ